MTTTRTTEAAAVAARLRAQIAAERRELADVLDGLDEGRWDAPSLCAGWRVREVAAHMSMGFRYSTPRVLAELVRSGGRLHRTTDRLARRDAAVLRPAELAGALREHATHPWTPPVGGLAAALGHDVVHGLDITEAIGLGRQVPAERLLLVLGGVDRRSLRFFRSGLERHVLRATDVDFTLDCADAAGTVEAPAQELVLRAFGRRPAA